MRSQAAHIFFYIWGFIGVGIGGGIGYMAGGDEGGFIGGTIGGGVLGGVGYVKGLNAFDRVVKCPNCGADMAVKKSHTRPFHHCPNCGSLIRLDGAGGGRTPRVDQNSNELASADIPLYTFINPAGLNAEGRNLYSTTQASGDATEVTPGDKNAGTLAQGFLEMSNVELVDEMVGLIVGQRAYEANSKSITTADSLLQIANQLKR